MYKKLVKKCAEYVRNRFAVTTDKGTIEDVIAGLREDAISHYWLEVYDTCWDKDWDLAEMYRQYAPKTFVFGEFIDWAFRESAQDDIEGDLATLVEARYEAQADALAVEYWQNDVTGIEWGDTMEELDRRIKASLLKKPIDTYHACLSKKQQRLLWEMIDNSKTDSALSWAIRNRPEDDESDIVLNSLLIGREDIGSEFDLKKIQRRVVTQAMEEIVKNQYEKIKFNRGLLKND